MTNIKTIFVVLVYIIGFLFCVQVVFAGDAAVGKTTFINRITKGYFMDGVSSTLGVDFQVKTFKVDERNVALQLWDTAGQVIL